MDIFILITLSKEEYYLLSCKIFLKKKVLIQVLKTN
jgi:hypothetical protein